MGQVRHGSARTTAAVRRAIQQSQERVNTPAERYAIDPKTVAKWKQRTAVHDAPMGPKPPRSTALTREQEAMCVAFRRPTGWPLDDGLDAWHSSIPHPTRSAWPRCVQRHGISRLPEGDGDIRTKKKVKKDPLGSFHLDMAEVHTAEGRLSLFGAIDRARTCALAERHEKATGRIAANFLRALIAALPSKIHTVLTEHGTPFTALAHFRKGADQPDDVQPPAGLYLM
jgi:hypothetical protein